MMPSTQLHCVRGQGELQWKPALVNVKKTKAKVFHCRIGFTFRFVQSDAGRILGQGKGIAPRREGLDITAAWILQLRPPECEACPTYLPWREQGRPRNLKDRP